MRSFEAELRLKRYEDIGQNEGKNSIVWKGYDEQLNAHFAVKEISKKLLIEDNQIDFFDESKKLYMNRHPNIAEIQFAAQCPENVYFAMPYYQNGSLNSLIDTRFLTVKEIIKFSLDFLCGVHYIHTNDLIHLDIKPTNILFDNNMRAMITDFGLSKYTDNYGLAKYSKFYTSHYPPECFSADVASKSVDIFQAGLTIYRMCNGSENFKNHFVHLKDKGMDFLKKAILKGNFPSRSYLPHIPKKLRRIINKAINPDPDKRFDSILEMMNAISVVNENLDIRCMNSGNKLIWEVDKSNTTLLRIELEVNDESYTVFGVNINKISQKSILSY